MASLRKRIVEHNCPSLPKDIAQSREGGYTGVTVVLEALKEKTEHDIQHLMKVLKNILRNDFRDDKERREFMEFARVKNWNSPLRSEAIKRVYRELYETKEVTA